MVMRQLTDQEKAVCSLQFMKVKSAQEMNQGELKKTQFDLDFLLDHETKLKKIHAETYIKRLTAEIADNQNTLDILETQLTNGVEVKVVIEDGIDKEVEEDGNR